MPAYGPVTELSGFLSFQVSVRRNRQRCTIGKGLVILFHCRWHAILLFPAAIIPKNEGAAQVPRPAFDGHAGRVPLPDGSHLGELLEERVVLLEAFLGALEHLHRLVLADLLDELLEM